MTELSEAAVAMAPDYDGEAQPVSLRSLMGMLAHATEKILSPGDLADLRRLGEGDIGSPAFWKVAALWLEPKGFLRDQGGEARDAAERRWAFILAGLATLGHLHQPGYRLGRALAEAGFSELRLVRLLRSYDETLLDLVRITARQLAAKGQQVDWADAAELVLSDGADHEESVRRRVARDFYKHLKTE
jgi:CRISPR system Cascade subunit CasB